MTALERLDKATHAAWTAYGHARDVIDRVFLTTTKTAADESARFIAIDEADKTHYSALAAAARAYADEVDPQ